MEAYPSEYVEHNLPLVLLSGLRERQQNGETTSMLPRQESGTKFQCSLPECSGERAQHLLQHFLHLDGSHLPWNASSLPGPSGVLRYRMKAIGRTYTLPPRKAAPLPQSPSSEGVPPHSSSPAKTELHSPFSPLSPGSPVFPDGVFTPLWLTKHQQSVPALLLAFFQISSSDSAAADEQLKADINSIRTAITRSGFKTRFSAVLLSDQSILQAPELEERLSSIRRLTSLDSKTGLFFMPPMSSPAEIATYAHNMMTTLQPLCVEYYRDLTKHARRKKAKAPVGSGLSTPGWNVRYEVKQGIFAEFRQEMDVAERHFSTAIDELFNAEGIFEATPSWSPRWEEARMLCDCLALRVLRCQLWSSQTTGAALSWVNYKARMKDLVDRRGRGSQTYGWEAWEARWAEVMAQLIQRADLPALRASIMKMPEESTVDVAGSRLVYAVPEKSSTTMERLPPFRNLHHSGYWLRLAARGSRGRRKKAQLIPQEDRIPPRQSPASAVASRPQNYDFYLVPGPHEEYTYDHVGEIASLTTKALEQFQLRGQIRMSDVMRLDLARDFADAERYGDAMEVLLPLWEESTWRDEDWHDIFAELLLLLHRCAEREGRAEVVAATAYELSSIRAPLPDSVGLDVEHCLDVFELEEAVELHYRDGERLCPVAVSFAFESKETHVGETVRCQLILVSAAREQSAALILSSVTLKIGASKTFTIVHSADGEVAELVDLSDTLEEHMSFLTTKASLTLEPGQRRILSFHLTFREAGNLTVTEVSTCIATEYFSIQHTFTDEELLRSDAIFLRSEDGALERKFLAHAQTTSVKVLPKPPKVRILVHGMRKQYYTDELLRLVVEIVNGELHAIEGEVSGRVGDEEDVWLPLRWIEEGERAVLETDSFTSKGTPVAKAVQDLEPAHARKVVLLVKAPSEPTRTTLTLQVDYNLSKGDNTPLRKVLTLDLNFAVPFEAKFSFSPMLYRDAWPSYFDANIASTEDQAGGIPQLWRLSSQVRSLATEQIMIHSVKPIVDNVIGESTAKVQDQQAAENKNFGPDQVERFTFQLHTQKYSFDDRRPSTIESTLAITWSHDEDSEPVTTRLPVPRLTLPVSEPRVLCTVVDSPPNESEWDATLQYYIENPSTHFLTFALTMEATEEFAFSGPKYRTLSLAPLSRHRVEYRIALQDPDSDTASVGIEDGKEGRWIWPSLQVIDSYYQKTLRVHPGSVGVKFDEKQNIAVFIEGV